MGLDAIVTIAVLVAVTVALALEWQSPDILLMAGLAIVVVVGVVNLETALAGFANSTLLAIGSLYVVAAAMRETGVLDRAGEVLLGSTRRLSWAVARMSALVAAGSAFLNNTPIVAMGVPAVRGWARRHEVSASRLLMPLSFASILGGLCTLVGTSTNLVADGLLRAEGYEGLGFFELARVGLPCAVVGLVWLAFAAPRLLADREEIRAAEERARPHPDSTHPVEAMREEHPHLELRPIDEEGELHEAVVRESSRLIGSTVGDADFPERFNSAVTGVRRGGERIEGEVGEVRVRPGDVLMLDTGSGFREAFEDNEAFYVMSGDDRPERRERRRSGSAGFAVAVLVAVVGLAATGVLHIAAAALLGALAMVVGGTLTAGEARDSVQWSVLLVIGAALGLGRAMEHSGAASAIGDALTHMSGDLGPNGVLAVFVVATMLLTGLITNNAAMALMFPVATSVAGAQGLDPRPLVIGVTIAASLAFWTPLGYQTNLMVFGPGNYRFGDFTRLGGPLQLLLAALCVALVPLLWP